MKLYRVGGAIRDMMFNEEFGTSYKTKDIDFAVEGFDSFEEMHDNLEDLGFEIFVVDAGTYNIRARVPKNMDVGIPVDVADFVWCRKDGPYSDGRHPDWVKPGTIYDDLARRDFTINAMAIDEYGTLLDPHGGERDCSIRVLKGVGDPYARIVEDSLRALRGLRFMVTRDLLPQLDTWNAINSRETAEKLIEQPRDRIRDELNLMFKHDSILTLELLGDLRGSMIKAIFRDNLRLKATSEL